MSAAGLTRRGFILPAIDIAMADLQAAFPRREFQRVGAMGDRVAVTEGATPWCRGGQSPGGNDMTLVHGAGAGETGPPGSAIAGEAGTRPRSSGTYAFGWQELEAEGPPPQRIVWTPPLPGQERFDREMAGGPVVDCWRALGVDVVGVQARAPYQSQDVDPAEWRDGVARRMPVDPAKGLTGAAARIARIAPPVRQLPYPEVASQLCTRVIPLTAHIWGSDTDDTEELAMWVMRVWQVRFGNLLPNTLGLVSGGMAPDEKGSRGLHFVLGVQLAVPVLSYPSRTVPTTGFGVGVSYE